MSNKEIYKQTLTFSLRRFVFNTCCLFFVGALAVFGFLLIDKMYDKGLIGLAVGILFGIIVVAIVSHFVSYIYKAGHIVMMMKAVTEGSLPADVYHEGKRLVKARFTTVALYYAATSAIKGIFNEIGRLITRGAEAIGGDTGNAIGSAISIGINVVVGFLCDCCLGWVFYRSDKGAVKATLEGGVIFFKNGKALLRNLGRIFGMGIASLIAIGGAFTGVFYLIFSNMTSTFEALRDEIMDAATRNSWNIPEFFNNPANLALITAVIVALIIWGIIHGTFIRPFILVGVIRNYMEAGIKSQITEADMKDLDKKSKKFKKLREQEGA